MRIFKPTYRCRKTGKLIESPRYHCSFKDHTDTLRRVVAYCDRSVSESLGRKLQRLAGLVAVQDSPGPELAKWIDGLTDDLRAKLIEWGLLDRRASMAARPLSEHVDDWYESILADGRTEGHASIVKVHVQRIIKACGFLRFSDIDSEVIKQHLAQQQRQDQLARESHANGNHRGFSTETRNSHVRAIKQFSKWMVDERRAGESHVAGLKTKNVRTDRRRVRRALSMDDLLRLLRATHDGPDRGRTTGPERALIYWVAVETGLRSSELRSLTAASFDLAADQPTVTVEAAYSKRRQRDTLVLTADLAASLRTHLRSKLPSAPAFNVPRRTADMLKHDLELAKIPYIDPESGEVFDFHSLRVQCATNLARGGAHPSVAKAIMRHSTIKLTMDVYTRVAREDQASALEALPKLSAGA